MRRLILATALGATLWMSAAPALAQGGSTPATTPSGTQASPAVSAGPVAIPTVGPRPGVPPPLAPGQAPYLPQNSSTFANTAGNNYFDTNNSPWAGDDGPIP